MTILNLCYPVSGLRYYTLSISSKSMFIKHLRIMSVLMYPVQPYLFAKQYPEFIGVRKNTPSIA
jgi:hypothetical protein